MNVYGKHNAMEIFNILFIDIYDALLLHNARCCTIIHPETIQDLRNMYCLYTSEKHNNNLDQMDHSERELKSYNNFCSTE